MSSRPFKTSLHYLTPSTERAIIKQREGLPETIKLHVSPFACGRRMTINAYRQHTKDKLVHLYIDESDIVSGCYEDLIPDAVEELLGFMKPRPRAIIIQVTCIDDLLGTDHDALRLLLEQRFPDVKFCIIRIDPIVMESGKPPIYEMIKQVYSLLSPIDHNNNAVNLVCGSREMLHRSEFFQVMSDMGMQVRQIYDCMDFDEFLDMAASRLNLVVVPQGEKAAEMMEEKLNIPWLFVPNSYRIVDIKQVYDEIAKKLGKNRPDLSDYETATQVKITRTREHLRDMPIIIDQSANIRPLILAQALAEYGFNIRMVFNGLVLDCDLPAFNWLKENRPEIKVGDGRRFDMMKMKNELGECMCIGPATGYILKAPHLVEFIEPGFSYGFDSINILMDKMYYAVDTVADYDKIRQESERWQPIECEKRRCYR